MAKYILVQIKAIDQNNKEQELVDYCPLEDILNGNQQVSNIDYTTALNNPGPITITQIKMQLAVDTKEELLTNQPEEPKDEVMPSTHSESD